jgi:hypothetical protein
MKKVVFLLLFCSFLLKAQSQRELYNNSIQAYETKNYSEFLRITKELDSIRPMHPTFTYNLAIAYALNQQSESAVNVLKKIILMNSKTAFEDDVDFQNIKETQAFKELLELKAKQSETIVTSKKNNHII